MNYNNVGNRLSAALLHLSYISSNEANEVAIAMRKCFAREIRRIY